MINISQLLLEILIILSVEFKQTYKMNKKQKLEKNPYRLTQDVIDNLDFDTNILKNQNIEKIDDSEPLEVQEAAARGYVLFYLPNLYNNVDIDKPNMYTNAIRACDYNKLANILMYVGKIEMGTHHEQIDTLKNLSDEIAKTDPSMENGALPYVKNITKSIEALGIVEDHSPITTNAISFDVIREYTFNELNLLVEAKPVTYGLYSFYSQIADPNLITEIRSKLNDTDYARIQYTLSQLRDTLLFKPDRAYFRLLNIINIYMLHLMLVSISHPVKNQSEQNLHHHYVANILDTTIRSRQCDAWYRASPHVRHLMVDIKVNYHPQLTRLMQGTAKDRFEKFIQQLNSSGNRMKHKTTYENYLQLLDKSKITVTNPLDGTSDSYYYIDHTFLTNLLQIEAFQSLTEDLSELKAKLKTEISKSEKTSTDNPTTTGKTDENEDNMME